MLNLNLTTVNTLINQESYKKFPVDVNEDINSRIYAIVKSSKVLITLERLKVVYR